MRIKAFCLLWAALAAPQLISAQTFEAPPWLIVSDYGPRIMDGEISFHAGIDYDGNLGDAIKPVEAGEISRIWDASGGGGHALEIQSGARVWWYFHTFRKDSLSHDNWERLDNSTLVATGKAPEVGHIIVRWANKDENKAYDIWSICRNENRKVQLADNIYIKTSTGDADALTECSVDLTSLISPVGDSGIVKGPHLHVALNGGTDNPLLYLPHEGGLSVQILSPPAGHLFLPSQLNEPYPIQVRVDSTAGLDMDKLMFVVQGAGTQQVLGPYDQPAFSYGGRLNAESFGGIKTDSVDKWVFPQDAKPETPDYMDPGLDDFVYDFQLGNLSLSDGEYTLEATAMDVNKNTYRATRIFRIDKTQPLFHLSSISPLYDNFRGTSTLTPSTLERAHTLDFEDAVAGISALVISGPAGFEGYSHVFEPPVSTTTLSFENMPLGPYEIRAIDAAGNESVAPFKISDLEVIVSTPDSMFYGLSVAEEPYGEVKFGCTLAVKTESSAPIERLDIYEFSDAEATRRLVKSVPGNALAPITYFDTGINPLVHYSTANYLFQVWDTDGNGKIKIVKVNRYMEGFTSDVGTYENAYRDAGWVTVHPGSGPGIFTGAPLDLQARPELTGGAVVNLGPGWPGGMDRNADVPSFVVGTLDKFTNLPHTDTLNIGKAEVYLLSSDSQDMAGAGGVLVAQTRHFAVATANAQSFINSGSTCVYNANGYAICRTDTEFPNSLLQLKRYSQIKLVLDVPAPSGILHGMCISGDETKCDEGYAVTLKAGANAYLTGAALEAGHGYMFEGKEAQPGENVKIPLGSGVAITFDSLTARGNVALTVQSGDVLPGFTAIPAGHSYNITGQLLAFDNATVAFPYDPSGLTPVQSSQLRVVRVLDAAKVLYEEFPAVIDADKKTVSARITELGRYMVVAPAYVTPHPVSAGSAGGGAELEFVSNIAVAVEKITGTSIFFDVMLKNLAANNLVPVGNVYYISPDNVQLSPAGAIKMRYDAAQLAALGIPESDIGLYEFTAEGSLLFKLPRQLVRPETGETVAAVPALYSLFAVLGKKYQPTPADIMMPETVLDYDGTVYYSGSGAVYITTSTKVKLTAADWDDANTTGLLASYYFRDRHPDFVCLKTGRDMTKPAGTCENPAYSEEFTLEEGSHTIYYQSADNAKNFEFVKSTDIYVDGTPPIVELFVGTTPVQNGGTAYIAGSDSITLTYSDPDVNWAASGVKTVYRLIDVAPEECYSETPPASCGEAEYTGVFSLASGTHTVYYSAVDNVGNISEIRHVHLDVKKALSINFFPAEKTATSVLWQWDLVEGATAYQVLSGTGGAVSSILPAGTSVYLQTDLQPNSEIAMLLRAYSVTETWESAVSTAGILANSPISVESFTSGQSASVVLGQSGFYSNMASAGSAGLSLPEGVALDANGNLWVADRSNHRVLRFSPPFSSGMSANLAIGQSSLYLNLAPPFRSADSLSQPESLAFDQAGNLWVADGYGGFNRVLRFSPPFFTGMNANLVIGAPDFYSAYYPIAPSDHNFGQSYLHIALGSSGAVWVSDTDNKRILRFSPPFNNGMAADKVLGQLNFNSNAAAYLPPNASGFVFPAGIAFDAEDNLWVADVYNHRVLKFEKPEVNGKAASLVIGQPDFNSPAGYATYFPKQNNFDRPASVTLDAPGNLYVFDYGGNRVLRFSPPFTNNMNADLVIGQPNFTSRVSATSPANFQSPWMGDLKVDGFVITDAHGRMWVSDSRNNRILLFESGKVQAFSKLGVSSFTVQWDANFNPGGTLFGVEISKNADFNADVLGSGDIESLNYTFTGLAEDTRYYVRVKAKNQDGVDTAYCILGSVVTRPGVPVGFGGVARSSNSISWEWAPGGLSSYQIFNATGVAISPVLPAGTTWYLQGNLSPNNTYSSFLRATNESGSADSALVHRTTLASLPGPIEIFLNGQDADFVIGQPDFTSSLTGASANRFKNFVQGLAKDANRNLWVVDNCRILRFPQPFLTNMSADLVLGQSDFSTVTCGTARNKIGSPYPPAMIAFDSDNRLWVSDTSNNRVLMFNPPFSVGMEADLVIGQADFSSKVIGSGLDRLNQPKGLSVDASGYLWIADSGNNRIVRYSPPFRSGMNGDFGYGAYAWPPTARSLNMPSDVKVDGLGNIWVADTGARRVQGFQPPFESGMNPAVVIGQQNFTSANGIVSQNGVRSPTSINFDKFGNMYLVDTDANRVLVYRPPFFNGMNALAVLGQPNFTYGAASVSRNGMQNPHVALAYDGLTLFVTDDGFRVLGYNANLPFVGTSSTTTTVRWYNTANPANTEYKVAVAGDASFQTVLGESQWVIASSYAIGGLLPGNTYYARLRVRNFSGIESGPLDLGYIETMPLEKIFARSSKIINGNPEIVINTAIATTVIQVDSATTSAAVYLGAASAAGLTPASNIYEIGPDGIYNPPANLMFYYSTASLAAVGLAESDVAVYEHFSGSGWVKLGNQTLDTINKRIIVPVTQISSLFGVFGIVLDKTAPTTTIGVSGPASEVSGSTYMNLAGTVTLSAFDSVVYGTTTGVAFTEYRIDSSTDADFVGYHAPVILVAGCHILEFRSRDNAGNLEEIKSKVLCADGIAPVSSVTLRGVPGRNDWYISSVTVSLVSTDNLSGVAESIYAMNGTSTNAYSIPINIASDGSHALRYYSVDRVGNLEAYRELAVNVDVNAPLVDAVLTPAANSSGWNNTTVLAVFTATDAASGLAYCEPERIVFMESSTRVISGYCIDNAGNASTVTLSVNIDTTPPGVAYTMQPAPDVVGWNNTAVRVMFSGTDALSGILECSSVAVSGEGIALQVVGSCSDLAGNVSYATATVSIDLTPPAIAITSPKAGETYIATRGKLNIGYAVTDNLGASPAASAYLVEVEDYGSPRGSRPAVIAVSPGQQIEPLDIDDGVWKLVVSATDTARNNALSSGGQFEIVHDVLAPRTTGGMVSGPAVVSGSVTYITAVTQLRLASVDDLVTGDDAIGLGVKRQTVQLRSGGTVVKDISLDNAVPKQDEVFVSTVAISALGLADGQYDLSYRAEDVLGNIEPARTLAIGLDNTAPSTQARISGLASDNGWLISTTTVTLETEDTLSGVAVINYQVERDGIRSDSRIYAGAFAVTEEGHYKVYFYAVDKVGNASAENIAEFKLDLVAPVVTSTITPAMNAYGWRNTPATVTFSGTDSVSGVSYCESAKTVSAEGKAVEISGYCRDFAGHSSTVTAGLAMDLTMPVMTASRTPAPNAFGWSNSDVTVSFACADALSGVKYCATPIALTTEGYDQGAAGSAVDYAGNISSGAIKGINIDRTTPSVDYSIAGVVYNGTYLNQTSRLALAGTDPVSGGTASGVDVIEYSSDGGAFAACSAPLALAPGKHSVSYRSRDKAGNESAVKSVELVVDTATPVTVFSFSGTPYILDGVGYITQTSLMSFSAVELPADGTGSGVMMTKYRLDGGDWQVYANSIAIPAEGPHTLDYYSIDNVQNAETQKSLDLVVDNSAPTAALTLGEPMYEVFGLRLITPDTRVSITAADTGGAGVKAIYYELSDKAGWTSGALPYTEPFRVGRPGTFTVLYWAVDNAGNEGAAQEARLRVSAMQSDALDAVYGLELSGTADIAGTVRSNTVVSLGGNARILGDVWASTITLTGKAQITGQRHNGEATLVPAPLELGDIVQLASATNNNNLIPARYLAGGRLVLGSKDSLTLSTGVYCFSGIDLSGGAGVSLDGKVDILVTGDVSLAGGSSFNAAGAASGLNLFLSTFSSLAVTGGGNMTAYVYAPYAQLKLAGNALLGGHYFVRSAVVSGGGNVLQGGETLPQTGTGSVDTGKKKASAFAPEAAEVLSGPDPAFRLGEVYVFPNPALRGDAPVFHVETGLADTVRIIVYTVSGRQAHEATLTGLPVALDDGNGLSYAYEYVWRGHIPSGVYYYHIEAGKEGQKLKKSGKFAVVR